MNTLRSIIARFKASLKGKPWHWSGAGLALVLVLVMLVPAPAEAKGCSWYDLPCHAAHLLTWFFQILTALMGYIMVLEVDGLIRVAQYNNFVAPGPTAVKVGWVVTRDLANMFFIVFLLIIAFDTIIRGGDSTYGYRKTLRRMLIMAIVINFSKTICGIFIDMSQVLLLSFVNGFKAAAAGNFFTAFGINKLLALAKGNGDYTFGLVLAMMFAFIMSAIAACIMLIMLVMLIFRVVMLWILIILSPIAFLTSSFPLSSENHYAKWWGMFKNNLTSGPIIAFFIWLALAVAQGTGGNVSSEWPASSTVAQAETGAAGNVQGGIPTEAGNTSDTILSMVIVISILMAGLKMASEQNVMGAGFAKTVRGRVEGTLKRVAMAPVGVVTGAAGSVYGAASNRAKQAGYGIAGTLASRVPGLRGIGAVAKAREQEFKDQRKKAIEKITGTEDQKQKFMRPQDYAARVANMNDPKKQLDAMKTSVSNPAIASEMFKERKLADGGTITDAARIVSNIAAKGKDKDVLDLADMMSSDKNLSKQMKKPEMQEDLGIVREKLQGIAAKDPNQVAKAAAFDQKFVAQLAQMPKLDAQGAPIPGETVIGDEQLKKMVPKMTADDIGGLDAKGLELLTKHMSDSQFAKARESTAGNSEKAEALKRGTMNALEAAKKGGDASSVAEAAKRAIHSGGLGAEGIRNDDKLRGMVGNRMDVSGLVRNMDRSSEGQRAAVGEVMQAVMAANPQRAKNMSKQEQYQEFMPSTSDFKSQDDEERESKAAEASVKFAKELGEVDKALEKAKNDLAALANIPIAQNEPTAAREAIFARKQKQIADVEKVQTQHGTTLKEKSSLEAQLAKIASTDKAGADAIKGMLADVEKTLRKIEIDLVKKKQDLEGGGKV